MHITKYFYNVETKECQFFVYSGCGGNANNFMTAVECESTCKNGTAVTMKVPPVNATSTSQPAQSPGYTSTPTSSAPASAQAASQPSSPYNPTGTSTTASVAPVTGQASPYALPQTVPTTTAQQTPTHAVDSATTTFTNNAALPPTGIASSVQSPAAVTISAVTPPSTSAQNAQLMNLTLYKPTESADGATPLTGASVRVTHKNVTDIPAAKRTLPGTPAKPHHADVTRQFVVDGEDCLNTKFGCCEDGNSPATGADKEGCPESKFCCFVVV